MPQAMNHEPLRTKAFRFAGVSFALSALLLMVVAGGLIHVHHSAEAAAACVICHVARTPLSQPAPVAIGPSKIVVAPVPQFQSETPRKEVVLFRSPSRAPPA